MKANLHIQTSFRDDSTKLGNCYFSPPFKVMNITEDKLGRTLHLMLMSSSPGILDDDDFTLKVEVVENGSLQLHTQSYQRLYNMQKGATQMTDIYLQNNSSFCFIPHPSVPHENAIFTTKNNIYLSNNCTLIWGEVLTCGRKLNGEVFQFSKYQSITKIFFNNRLIIKENLLMQPLLVSPNLMGQLEGFTHQASLMIYNESVAIAALCDILSEYLLLQKDIEFGVSSLHKNGLIMRLLGNKAEQLYDCLKSVATMFQSQILLHGC